MLKQFFKPNKQFLRKFHHDFQFTKDNKLIVTLFKGHGIGPEISDACIKILDRAGANIHWEEHDIGKPIPGSKELVSQEAIDSVLKNKLALKGPLATPIGKGYRSLNITLRKALSLYANVRPAISIPPIEKYYKGVDMVVIRENTEGEYCGLEHQIVPGVVESLKVITEDASMRIAKYAFNYCKEHNRKKLSVIHKANVMKLSDGLFLDCCQKVAKDFPEIELDIVQLETCCLEMARNPQKFDVMVTTNLYGDIVSDLAAGLIGGLGLTPSGNYGKQASLFEAVHGTAPDIEGKDLANPTALLLSSVMLLKHVGKLDVATKIENSLKKVFAEKKHLTGDLGGNAKCSEFTNEVISNLH